MRKWQKWYPTVTLVSALPFVGLIALALLHPRSPVQLLPAWGANPSANQVVGIFCIVMTLAMLFEAVAARVAASGPDPKITQLAGSPATFLRRGATQFAGHTAGVLCLASLLGALAGLGLRSGNVAIAALLGVPAAWLAGMLVPIILRRYTPGGVWLTPAGLTDRFRGTEVTLAWDDVAGAEFGGFTFNTLLSGTSPAVFGGAIPVAVGERRQRAHTLKNLSWIWQGAHKPTANAVFLDTCQLGVSPGTLARIIVHYARNPSSRPELGTEASLTTLAALRDDSAAERGYLPVSPPPPAPWAQPPMTGYDGVQRPPEAPAR